MEALATARRREDSLIVGRLLRCPRCGTLSDLLSYFVFDRPANYADELNVVVKCRAKVPDGRGKIEVCRCVFSPGVHDEELFAAKEAA